MSFVDNFKNFKSRILNLDASSMNEETTKNAIIPVKIPYKTLPIIETGIVPYHWITNTEQNKVPLVSKAKITSPWLKAPPKRTGENNLTRTA